MKSHKIIGGGGVGLNVIETGNPNGQPILFIHGFTQCRLAWSKQLNSDLAGDHRLVAMDLRGHGESDKPTEPGAYMDSKLWADDVDAVIETLALKQPILSGWSYGPLVILDYIRYYGEDRIGGVQFVGGITKLGTDEATAFLTPEILSLVPAFFSTEAESSVQGLRSLIGLFFSSDPSAEDLYFMLGYNALVPPHVRQALFSRTLDNDDLLSKMEKPILITQGRDDRIVYRAAAEQIRSVAPNAEMDELTGVGHGLFWEAAASFNLRLRDFALTIKEKRKDQETSAVA